MTNIIQGLTGGNTPTITNPFTPFPLVTPTGAAASLTGAGGLTPDQQAFLDLFSGQGDILTEDIYSRLGLGGSTMEAQDRAAGRLRTAGEASTLESGNINQAIQEQQVAGGQQQGLAQLATQAGLGTQGLQVTAQQNAFNQGVSSLNTLASAAKSLFS